MPAFAEVSHEDDALRMDAATGPLGDLSDWARPAAVRETHVGVVILLGSRALKLKKPVRTAFLDFSTPARRRAACERELLLNRRLAADVYLGLGRLAPADTGPAGGTRLPGAFGEPLVIMRRMPEQRRLATLVLDGADVGADLRALAKLVAAFHARAERGPHIDAEATRDTVRRRWLDNIAELRTLADSPVDKQLLDDIESLALRFLDGRERLFTERIAAGRIVDGHGDLIAQDVFCLEDGPRALDCLEFDDRLRYLDGLDDVAFLAMDLERLGNPELADAWLAAYAQFSGDPAPVSLRHHYVAYRALVRAKVACLRHHQAGPAAPTETVRDARQHASLAYHHLAAGAVRLALVGGLPGTGKTTLADGLASRFGAVVLSSDRIRKELAGINPEDSATAGYQRGIYTPERTEQLYAELIRRAERLLSLGESVIIDASWTSRHQRARAEALARGTRADLIRLRCQATMDTAGRRIAARAPNPSDATVPIAEAMASETDPWPEAITVPTSSSVARSLHVAAAAWRTSDRQAVQHETVQHQTGN